MMVGIFKIKYCIIKIGPYLSPSCNINLSFAPSTSSLMYDSYFCCLKRAPILECIAYCFELQGYNVHNDNLYIISCLLLLYFIYLIYYLYQLLRCID